MYYFIIVTDRAFLIFLHKSIEHLIYEFTFSRPVSILIANAIVLDLSYNIELSLEYRFIIGFNENLFVHSFSDTCVSTVILSVSLISKYYQLCQLDGL